MNTSALIHHLWFEKMICRWAIEYAHSLASWIKGGKHRQPAILWEWRCSEENINLEPGISGAAAPLSHAQGTARGRDWGKWLSSVWRVASKGLGSDRYGTGRTVVAGEVSRLRQGLQGVHIPECSACSETRQKAN